VASYIVRIAAIAVIVCFFLPWATASCQGNEIGTYSGQDLASGIEVDAGLVQSSQDGESELWFVLVSGIVILLLSGLIWLRAVNRSLASIGVIVLAVISLGIVYTNYQDLSEQVEDNNGELAIRYGGWGTVVALAAAVAAGAVDFGQGTRDPRARAPAQPTPPAPPAPPAPSG
jgi:hypothetical protein